MRPTFDHLDSRALPGTTAPLPLMPLTAEDLTVTPPPIVAPPAIPFVQLMPGGGMLILVPTSTTFTPQP